jgi:antitoxin HigA-1
MRNCASQFASSTRPGTTEKKVHVEIVDYHGQERTVAQPASGRNPARRVPQADGFEPERACARAVHVASRRINEIVLGKRDITADTDLRLARYFGVSEGFFLGLQMDYDLMQRRRQIDRDLKAIRPRAA